MPPGQEEIESLNRDRWMEGNTADILETDLLCSFYAFCYGLLGSCCCLVNVAPLWGVGFILSYFKIVFHCVTVPFGM